MKKQYKIILAVILAVICLGYAGWSMTRPLTVKTTTLAAGTLQEKYAVQGTLLPQNSLILNAGESGIIARLPFPAGQSVKAGETVAVLSGESNPETELRLAQLRQGLSAARQEYTARYGDKGAVRANLELAQGEYDRAKWDYDAVFKMNETIPGSYTEAEVKALESRLSAAEQNLALAEGENSQATKAYYQEQITSWESQIASLEKTMEANPVTAPYDGVLWELFVEEGAYVSKYQPLAKLYGQGEMKLEAGVLTEDAMRLSTGDIAYCTLADGTEFTAEVVYISPVANKGLSAIGIEESRNTIELDPGPLPASVGAGHQVDIVFTNVQAENVLTAPLSSIIPLAAGEDGVYVIKDKKAVLTPVVTGKKGGGYVELSSGVTAGDLLILDPFDQGIKEGMKVATEN